MPSVRVIEEGPTTRSFLPALFGAGLAFRLLINYKDKKKESIGLVSNMKERKATNKESDSNDEERKASLNAESSYLGTL